jgi:hypothetical protein
MIRKDDAAGAPPVCKPSENRRGEVQHGNLIVPAKASRGQLPLVSSQTRERVPHSSTQNTAQCKAIHYYLLYLLIHPSPGTRLV